MQVLLNTTKLIEIDDFNKRIKGCLNAQNLQDPNDTVRKRALEMNESEMMMMKHRGLIETVHGNARVKISRNCSPLKLAYLKPILYKKN